MSSGKATVLVTGAAGFLGKYVVKALLMRLGGGEEGLHEEGKEQEEEDKEEEGENEAVRRSSSSTSLLNIRLPYTHIICLDLLIDDRYRDGFESPFNRDRLLPMQFDLSQLIDKTSSAYSSFLSTLRCNNVSSVIHTAAIVDTRELETIQDMVMKVNFRASIALFDAARDSEVVSRFVHISSAAAVLEKKQEYSEVIRTSSSSSSDHYTWSSFILSRIAGLLRLPDSMLSNMSMATYGRSKREAELHLLERWNSISKDGKGSMKLVILRPHVVWGVGDPIATDRLLQWPKWLPVFIVGDPDHKVTSINVRLLAEYIVLADFSLLHSKNTNTKTNTTSITANLEITGKILNIGDRYETFTSLYNRLAGLTNATVYSLPTFISYAIVFGSQVFDSILSQAKSIFGLGSSGSFQLLRVLTPNNLAYMTGGLLDDQAYVSSFLDSSKYLFKTALKLSSENDRSHLVVDRGKKMTLAIDDTDDDVEFQNWLERFNIKNKTLPPSQPYNTHLILSAPVTVSKDNKDMATTSNTTTAVSLTSLHTYFSPSKFLRLTNSQRVQYTRTHEISQNWSLGKLQLKNRVIKAATFESMCDLEGVPSDELIRFHTQVVRGGAAMTIVAYGSVSEDGRSFPTQICLHPGTNAAAAVIFERTKAQLLKLCESCHGAGGKVCIQLTHAGAFADPTCNHGKRAKGPDSIFNPLTMQFAEQMDEGEMNRIESDFVRAIDVCKEIGFDAVEIHLGHGYLLSQFLSARTNPRYAKEPRKRLEFPLRVLKNICDRAHNDTCSSSSSSSSSSSNRWLAVLVKYNISELSEKDLTLADCVMFTRAFHDEAGADLLVPSGGHVMVNGLHMLRGGAPVEEMAKAQRSFFKSILLRWLGPILVPAEPYHEAFFWDRTIQVFLGAGVPFEKLCLIGGVQRIETAMLAVDKTSGLGASAVQMGRTLLADPLFCLKVGISADVTGSFIGAPVNICDRSNNCIVGATMALQPLRCSKYSCSSAQFDII